MLVTKIRRSTGESRKKVTPRTVLVRITLLEYSKRLKVLEPHAKLLVELPDQSLPDRLTFFTVAAKHIPGIGVKGGVFAPQSEQDPVRFD